MTPFVAKHSGLAAPVNQRAVWLCYFWFGCTVLFAALAWVASQGTTTKLPRSGFRISVRADNHVQGKFRVEEIVNDLAERHDRTVTVLEQFIQKTARTNVMLNLICVGLSGCALAGQCLTVRGGEAVPNVPAAPMSPRRLRSTFGVPDVPEAVAHDGSFPDSGYAH
jgi:hypothetical protein